MKLKHLLFVAGSTSLFSLIPIDHHALKNNIIEYTYTKPYNCVQNLLNGSKKNDNTFSIIKEYITSTIHQSKDFILLDVPLENQMPELNNGCEIVALQMLVEYKTKQNINKLEFVKLLPIDSTPLTKDKKNNIISWGDPDLGFVGDVTGSTAGYIINPHPLYIHLKNHFPTITDLTGVSYTDLQYELSRGNPIVVWVNKSFKNIVAPEQWYVPSSHKLINAEFDNHAILLTGYDREFVYYNDPIGGTKEKVEIQIFINNFKYLGSKALTIY